MTATTRTIAVRLPAKASSLIRRHRAVSASFTLIPTSAGGAVRTTATVKRLR